MADSPYVINVTTENFHHQVLEASHETPVLVDFWAEWCAPCRMLGPILDAIATSMAGKLLVAKVNTEEQQELAAQFGIRSLPTVKLFKAGQPVDEFMGALPEADIRAFLQKHIPRESDNLVVQAEAWLDSGDHEQAASLLEKALGEDPDNPRGIIANARLKAAQGDFAGAETALNTLPLDQQDNPNAQALRAAMVFDKAIADAPDMAVLDEALEADPGNSEARYQRAAHKVIARDYEGALEDFLALLIKDRKYADDGARKAMLQVFDLLGGSGDLVNRYRAKMTTALF